MAALPPTFFDLLDRNHDGVVTREEFHRGLQSLPGAFPSPGPPSSPVLQHATASQRTNRNLTARIVGTSTVLEQPVVALADSQSRTAAAHAQLPTSLRMREGHLADITFAAQKPASMVAQGPLTPQSPVSPVSVVKVTDSMSASVVQGQRSPVMMAKVLDVRPVESTSVERLVHAATRSTPLPAAATMTREFREWLEAERVLWNRSLQDTLSLQMRSIEDLVEQKVSKAKDHVTQVTVIIEDRLATAASERLELRVAMQEMRFEMDRMQARLAEPSGLPRSSMGLDRSEGQVFEILSDIRADMEAMRAQQLSTMAEASQGEDRIRALEGAFRGQSLQLQASSEKHLMHLQAQLADLRRECALLSSQQRQQASALSELRDLEGHLLQHLDAQREEHRSEGAQLRQELEAALASGHQGEDFMDLRRRYEQLAVAVEGLSSTPPEMPYEMLQTMENERQERAEALAHLSAVIEAECDQRRRAQQDLEARLQHAEWKASQAASGNTLQGLRTGAQEARPDREALADLGMALEAERTVRAQELRREREERTRELRGISSTTEQLATQLARLELVRAQEVHVLERELSDHRDSVERHFLDLKARIQASDQRQQQVLSSPRTVDVSAVAGAASQELLREVRMQLEQEMQALSAQQAEGAAAEAAQAFQRVWELRAEVEQQLASLHARLPKGDESPPTHREAAQEEAEQRSLLEAELACMRAGLSESTAATEEWQRAADIDMTSLRELVELLRERVDTLGMAPEHLEKLGQAVEAEAAQRNALESSLNMRLTKEVSEVKSLLAQQRDGWQEALNMERLARNADIEALRMAQIAESMKNQVHGDSDCGAAAALSLAKSVQAEVRLIAERERIELAALSQDWWNERESRSREGSSLRTDFTRAVEQEREERLRQCSELQAEMLKALAKEHDDRLDIAKAMRERHSQPCADLEADPQAVGGAEPEADAQGGTSLMGRIFGRSSR